MSPFVMTDLGTSQDKVYTDTLDTSDCHTILASQQLIK